MRIRTKLIITTIIGVFLSISVSVIIASVLIGLQNQEQNDARLSNALEAIEKNVLDKVSAFDEKYRAVLAEASKESFERLLKTKLPIALLTADRQLYENLVKMGLFNETDYAFYSEFGASKGNSVFAFHQDLGQIVLEKQALVFDVRVIAKQLEDGGPPPPSNEGIGNGYGIQVTDNGLFLSLKDPYVFENRDLRVKVEPGMLAGHFIFRKSLSMDLLEQGRFLGIDINVYDAQGKMIGGRVPLPDLDLNTNIEGHQTLSDASGESFDVLVRPIVFQDHIIGYLSTGISNTITNGKIQENVIFLSVAGAIMLLLISLVANLVVIQVTKPLGRTAILLNEIASVGGDLTQRMEVTGSGELSKLGDSFNLFITKVQHIIQNVKNSSDTLATSSEELCTSTSEMSQTADEISRAISDEHCAIQDGAETVSEMVKALELMFEKIKTIQANATTAKGIAAHGGGVVDKTSQTMSSIEENTRKIEGVVGVITEIANQTNLLSLNAAIEAAKAGSSGKGFAIVADEVRALAEKSAHQVVEIRNLVDISRSSVKTGASVISEIQTVFNQIQEEAERVLENVNEVTSDISTQEKSINNVSEGMNKISTLSEENSAGIEELSRTLNLTDGTTKELSHLADEISASINEFQV